MNTIRMTFGFNFDSYQLILNSMDTHQHRSQEKLSIKKASLWLLVNL